MQRILFPCLLEDTLPVSHYNQGFLNQVAKMKVFQIISLAAVATAFVLPDEHVLRELKVESHKLNGALFDKLPTFHRAAAFIRDHVDQVAQQSKSILDEALSSAACSGHQALTDVKSVYTNAWLTTEETIFGGGEHPPHHGPPHHGPPHHGPPHHGPPHHGHGKSNQTIYQLISESKYTTKLAKLISEDDELVKALNGTAANYTVFAPTDFAFAKIPEDAPKPSKEFIKNVLLYHVVPDLYPAGRVLGAHTVPTLLKESELGKSPLPQRLSFNLGWRGLTVNFYSRIVAVNIVSCHGLR